MKVTTVGIDLAKNLFQLHGVEDRHRGDLLRPCHTTRHAGPHRAVREVEVKKRV